MTQTTKNSSNSEDSIEFRFPDIARKRADGVDWLYSQWRDDETGTGWPHSPLYDRVTSWGGSMDAVRGLVELGESPYNPKIKQALEWIESVQKHEGGWEIWETSQGLVESTGWGIITLRLANRSLDDEHLQAAAEFLIDAAQEQATGYAWGTAPDHPCRIYSTLVATLALDGLEQTYSEGGAEWLQTVVNRDGGWGFRPDTDTSNVAMTAMVLYVLRRVGAIKLTGKQTRQAKQFILDEQNDDGTWDNLSESWAVDGDGQVTMEHGTQPWAIMALLETDIEINNEQLLRGVQALAERQASTGAYLYDLDDAEENVWYTANCLVALDRFNQRLVSPDGVQAIVKAAVSDEFGPMSEQLDELDERTSQVNDQLDALESELDDISDLISYRVPVMYVLVGIVLVISFGLHSIVFDFATANIEGLIITVFGAIISVALGGLWQGGYLDELWGTELR